MENTSSGQPSCPFFEKLGSCRHSEHCERTHHSPSASETLLIRQLYLNNTAETALSEGKPVTEEELGAASIK